MIKKLVALFSGYEWKHIKICIGTVLALSLAPFIFGYIITPDGYFYNGLHALTHGDFSVYYSYINQIKNGQTLLYNNFTLEPHGSGTFNIFWFVVGKTAKLLHLTPAIALLVFKAILIPICIVTLYYFTSIFFAETKKRIIALWLFCFSSGVGTFAIPFLLNTAHTKPLNWPIDYWVPESNTFLTLYHLPHSILSLTLILLIYILFLKSLHYKNWKYSLYAGLLGLILFNYHPYHTVTVNAVIGFYLLVQFLQNKKDWILYLKIFLMWFLPSTLMVIYHYLLIISDFIIGTRATQNITVTPSLLYVVLGYGVVFFAALFGLYYFFKHKKNLSEKYPYFDFIAYWFILNSILLYFPITFQRRFLSGYHIPMILLAVFGLSFYSTQIKDFVKKKKEFIYPLLFLALFLSSFVNVVRDFTLMTNHNPNLFNSIKMQEAIQWFADHNTDNHIILTEDSFDQEQPFSASFWIPSYINQKTFISHNHETLFHTEKSAELKNLVLQNDSIAWTDFYKKYNIGYIMLKDSTQNRYYNSANLEQVYSNNGYLIFQTDLVK